MGWEISTFLMRQQRSPQTGSHHWIITTSRAIIVWLLASPVATVATVARPLALEWQIRMGWWWMAMAICISRTPPTAVRKVDAATGIITTVAGNGNCGSGGDGGPATSAAVGSPKGLAFDMAGNLYIVERYNGNPLFAVVSQIRRWMR